MQESSALMIHTSAAFYFLLHLIIDENEMQLDSIISMKDINYMRL